MLEPEKVRQFFFERNPAPRWTIHWADDKEAMARTLIRKMDPKVFHLLERLEPAQQQSGCKKTVVLKIGDHPARGSINSSPYMASADALPRSAFYVEACKEATRRIYANRIKKVTWDEIAFLESEFGLRCTQK